jgi:hypothetical protein
MVFYDWISQGDSLPQSHTSHAQANDPSAAHVWSNVGKDPDIQVIVEEAVDREMIHLRTFQGIKIK